MEYWGDEICGCPFEVLNSACWRRQVIKNESSRDQIRFDGLGIPMGQSMRKVKAIIGSSILDDYCTQNNIVLTFCNTISNVLSEKNLLSVYCFRNVSNLLWKNVLTSSFFSERIKLRSVYVIEIKKQVKPVQYIL